jgi:hypothetical protein
MRAYGARHRQFGFKERAYPGAQSNFEGIALNEGWKKVSLTHEWRHFQDEN